MDIKTAVIGTVALGCASYTLFQGALLGGSLVAAGIIPPVGLAIAIFVLGIGIGCGLILYSAERSRLNSIINLNINDAQLAKKKINLASRLDLHSRDRTPLELREIMRIHSERQEILEMSLKNDETRQSLGLVRMSLMSDDEMLRGLVDRSP